MGRGGTVLVADDNVLVRDLLHAVLGQTGEFEIVASVGDADGAGWAAAEHEPDVALVDVRMPGGGPAAARAIRRSSPDTRVIALSSHDDAVSVRLMLAAGAISYVVKGTPPEELLEVMRAALAPPAPPPAWALSGPPQRILVALADAAALDELADAVMATPGLELAGLAQTAYHALSLAARLQPDIAVVDAALASGGARVGASVLAASPGTRIIAWATARTATAPALSEASILVAAREPAAALLEAVERVAAGGAEPPPDRPFVVLGTPAGGEQLPSRRRFERLASVLARGRVDVELQPIVGLDDDRPHGYEALARFPGHPNPGPDVWFAEAHRAEVGIELERLAVRSGLAELDKLPPDAFLSVNVSPDTAAAPGLRDDLAAVDPSRVVVELTEHAPVRDYEELTRALDGLRELGARVAVDDCGAGFTSLRHVALVAPDYLKLDMMLCRDVREPARAALARALVAFAAETGSAVIAEGIERSDDLAALRELGVGLGQGYLLARPAVAESLLRS
jgi:EAL domain-containing protein (putative c-di-GMP-specific phosphodiesterase class I)/DNA-binding NarL/FixJ family response regulator